jgi:hypothetical protein
MTRIGVVMPSPNIPKDSGMRWKKGVAEECANREADQK